MMASSRNLMAGGIFVVLGLAAACGKSDDGSSPSTGGTSGKVGSGTGGSTGGTKASGGTGGSTGGSTTGGTSSDAGAPGDATGGSGGKGGTSSTGGTGGTGDPVAIDTMCSAFTACGGDVVGTWTVTKICGNPTADGAAGAGGSGSVPDCATNDATTMVASDAIYDFKSDGTYTVTGSLTYSVNFTIDDACAMADSVPSAALFCQFGNLAGFECMMKGADCVCGYAQTQDESSAGTYTIDGNSVTVDQTSGSATQAGGTHDFCVKGDTLTLSDGGSSQLVFTRQ